MSSEKNVLKNPSNNEKPKTLDFSLQSSATKPLDLQGHWGQVHESCSGELEDDTSERPYKDCPDCGGIMYWDGYWECTNCDCEIYIGEDDNDGIIEG